MFIQKNVTLNAAIWHGNFLNENILIQGRPANFILFYSIFLQNPGRANCWAALNKGKVLTKHLTEHCKEICEIMKTIIINFCRCSI